MIEKGNFLAAAFAASEAFLHLTYPASAMEDCIPLSQIFRGRIIYMAGKPLELPEGIEVRAVLGEPIYGQTPPQEPCIKNPTLMLNVPIEGYDPYILVRVGDGKVVHEEPEKHVEPFASLKELLPLPELNYPEE